MKKKLLYPLLVLALGGVGASFFQTIPFNFGNLFVDYPCEFILLAVCLILTTVLICHEVNSSWAKEEKEKMLQLQKERDSYKERFEKLAEVDKETRRLRAVIMYKKGNDASGSDSP